MRHFALVVVLLLGQSNPSAGQSHSCTYCPPGEYVAALCTPTTATTCSTCPYGYFQPAPSLNENCDSCHGCDVGVTFQSMPCTTTSDSVCNPVTTCTAGTHQELAPTATSDRVCTFSTMYVCKNGACLGTNVTGAGVTLPECEAACLPQGKTYICVGGGKCVQSVDPSVGVSKADCITLCTG